MKTLRRLWIFAVLSLMSFVPQGFASQKANPEVEVTCYQDQGGGYWWNYCEHIATGSTSHDVLYYLHGLNGNQYEWEESPVYSQIYQVWGNQAPIVISISYGSAWLLAQKNASGYSGLYENFVTLALPQIEKERNLTPAHRLLLGLSMGGFNAAQLYLKNPGLFSKVGLACPAITSVGPYSGTEAISAYEARTGALNSYVNNALYLSSSYFPDQTSWATADPIALSTIDITPSSAPLYVSGGLQDQYGFFEGAAAFVASAKERGATATWVPLAGGHCTYDWAGTARFFIAQ